MALEAEPALEQSPVISHAASIELLASLRRCEEDKRQGLGKLMTMDELKDEMRASFEKITSFKAG
ncbi:MAG: hypothetical protein ACKVON_06375 [Beijerinckiaceae bacterium]